MKLYSEHIVLTDVSISFTLRPMCPHIQWILDYICLRAVLAAMTKRKLHAPPQNVNPAARSLAPNIDSVNIAAGKTEI
jgi:hypothetical protein